MPQPCAHAAMDPPDADFTGVLEESKEILRQCFATYRLEEVFFSFNGGKDCTVLLDVTLDVLRELQHGDAVAGDLKVVYIQTSSPFAELEDFIREIEKRYKLKLVHTEGGMKETLQKILDEDRRLKACLLGTRRTDPYCESLQFMQKTDENWPQVMRVSPLLNWTYHHIWSYIHSRQVPYCSLYNKGYTSIGSKFNTWPNPALCYKDSGGAPGYHPAWLLEDASLERAGRGTTPLLPSIALPTGLDSCYGQTEVKMYLQRGRSQSENSNGGSGNQ